jgi:predicted ATPase/class 3 adenylate cyclase
MAAGAAPTLMEESVAARLPAAASGLPSGTVTFLFTDIEGSTNLLTNLGAKWPATLSRHHAIVRRAIAAYAGQEVHTEGDAFFVVFRSAAGAVGAAIAATRDLEMETWPTGHRVRVRMGLHTGIGELSEGDYVGLDVHRAARVAAAGHGGQVLLTDATRALVGALPSGVTLRDYGEHRLKDLPDPEHLFGLRIPGLQDEFPPLRTLTGAIGNLPQPVDRFFGRAEEIDQLSALVGTTRLVTLTGPGGTGKTRLSIEVASRIRPGYPGGAWFVPLEAVRDPELVVPAIASTIGAHVGQDMSPEEAVAARLALRPTLIVLDNLEQVVTAASSIGRIVSSAATVRVLCSSREPLRVSGEQEFAVPPLRDDPAVTLFVDRARQVRPDFDPDPAALRVIRRICEQVDGLPLAIELAAARVRVLSLDAIQVRLADRLGLLAGDRRDMPDRQRTLRGAIDWSYQLLPPEERTFFARLSVFVGAPELEAVEVVVRPSEDLGLDATDAITSLVEKSLLRRLEGPLGVSRFGMLETIRAYASEKLEESAAPDLRRRHAELLAARCEALEPELLGERPTRYLDDLELDHGDIRAAIDWSLTSGQPAVGLRIAAAIWRFWQQRWHLSEARPRLVALLEAAGPACDPLVRARGLTALGGVAYWQGDFSEAQRCYVDALAIYRELGDAALVAGGVYDLAFTKAILGEIPQGRELVEESLTLYRRLGDARRETLAREAQAVLTMMAGDLPRARSTLDQVIADYRAARMPYKLADTLAFSAALAVRTGDATLARAQLGESVLIARRIGDESSRATGLQVGALIALAEGDAEGAALLAGAFAALRDLGEPFLSPSTTIGLADPELEARAALEASAFLRAFEEGRRMPIDVALDRVAHPRNQEPAPEP